MFLRQTFSHQKRKSFSPSTSRNSTMESSSSSNTSRLSKEDIEEIINSPYDTGYTYSESAAYIRKGSTEFRHPQLCRRIRAYMSTPYHENISTDSMMKTIQSGTVSSGILTYFSEVMRIVSSLLRCTIMESITLLTLILKGAFLFVLTPVYTLHALVSLLATGVSGQKLYSIMLSLYEFVSAVAAFALSTIAYTIFGIAYTGNNISRIPANLIMHVWRVLTLVVRETVIYAVTTVVFIARTAIAIVYLPIIYAASSIVWLATGGFLRSSSKSQHGFLSSPVSTSTPVMNPQVDMLRKGRPLKRPAASHFVVENDRQSNNTWRCAGRTFAYVMRFLFWLIVASAIFTSLFFAFKKVGNVVYNNFPSTMMTYVNTPTVMDFSSSLQSQLDAIHAQLNQLISRVNAEGEVVASRLSALERDERYEQLIAEIRHYEKRVGMSDSLRTEIQAMIAAAVSAATAEHAKTSISAPVSKHDDQKMLGSNVVDYSETIFDENAYLEKVRELIHEQIRLYDADKTGLPDYALESSGGAIASIRCTVPYNERSRTQMFFGISLWHSSYSPRSVIQRKGHGASAGECWAFVGGHGYLTIKLSNRIDVTAVSYEHLPVQLSPDGHIQTAPRDFLVYSYQDINDLDSRFLLGNFTYQDNGEPLQMFYVQRKDPKGTPIIELETLNNHGSMVTCLYRFRVHGNLSNSHDEL